MGSDRKVISVKFNQDQGCFACSMESGIRIYNVEPLVEKAHYDADTVGSVAQCEMLFRTNLLAIISGGSRPKFADNVLTIFDDLTKKFILEISFPSSIRAVRLRKDKIIVALLNQINVFSFPTPTQRLFTLETRENHRGLCDVSPLTSAEKQILDLSCTEIGISSAPVWIGAHKSELGCLALNQQGTRLATASNKGTLIRVWDTTTKNHINFSRDSDYLCCSSDKGTVHIFAIKNTNLNKRILIPSGGILGKYGESQWALANFTVPPECACICAFGPNSSVIAICLDGTFHKYVFSSDGICNREAYDVYLDVCDDEDYLQ
nr:unnamed protein product [Callosobruchus chinensis]